MADSILLTGIFVCFCLFFLIVAFLLYPPAILFVVLCWMFVCFVRDFVVLAGVVRRRPFWARANVSIFIFSPSPPTSSTRRRRRRRR
jgi:hypothetical protein